MSTNETVLPNHEENNRGTFKIYGPMQALAVVSCTFIQHSMALQSPALGAISTAFPDAPIALVQSVSSIPSMATLFVCLVCGFVERFVKRRTFLIIGIIFCLIFGILPAIISTSLVLIVVFRVLYGIGYSILMLMGISLIPDLWASPARETMFTVRQFVAGVSGIFLGLLGGYLANMNWKYGFWGFLIFVPFCIYAIIKLPEPKLKRTDSFSFNITKRAWKLNLWNCVAGIFLFTFITNAAIVIEKTGMGTPEQAGFVMSIFSVGVVVPGVSYAFLIKRLKGFLLPSSFLLGAIGFTICMFATNTGIMYVGAILFGITFGFYHTDMYVRVSYAQPEDTMRAYGWHVALNGFGEFLSPYVLAGLLAAFGISAIPQASWYIATPVLVGVAIFLYFAEGKRARLAKKGLKEPTTPF